MKKIQNSKNKNDSNKDDLFIFRIIKFLKNINSNI